MLKLFLPLMLLIPDPPADDVVIQLRSATEQAYEDWQVKLDDGTTLPFDADGKVVVSPQEKASSFEIIDGDDRSRYLGLWNQYRGQETITIAVGQPDVVLTEVVSAERTRRRIWDVPEEVGVVKPADQPERAVTQTSDLLKEEAEIMLQKTNLGGGSPIMRGMSGNRVLLMVDGFRLNNGIFRLGLNQYMNTIPGGQLEQIEVVSGPTGVQYGSDGLGGTIHMRSSDPASLGPANVTYRGFLSTADGTHTHRVNGHGNVGDTFFSAHLQQNDYQDLEAGGDFGEQLATGYDSWDGSFQATHLLNENRRLRLINTISEAQNVPRTDRIVSGRDILWEYHPQKQRLHGLRYEETRASGMFDFMDVGLGYLEQDEGTRRISSSSPNRLREERTLVDTWQFNGTFTKLQGPIRWVYGFDTQWDAVDSTGLTRDLSTDEVSAAPGKFPNDADTNTMGLFGTAAWQLAPRQEVKLGLRQTIVNLTGTLAPPIGQVDEDYDQLTPSLAWHWDSDQVFVGLNISQGFRAPNLEDALALGPSNQGFDAPNPGLAPETLWNYEAILRWRAPYGVVQTSLYTARYEDLIERVPGTYQGDDTYLGEPVFILDNVGEARVDGVSLQYDLPINAYLRMNTDATYTYGTQTDRNEPMSRIPPLRGNLRAYFEKSRWRLASIFTWAERQDRLSPRDLDDSRIPADGTPGYGVLHLRSRYQITDQIGVNLALENVFDKLYKAHGSGIFEPGRRAVIELEASWR